MDHVRTETMKILEESIRENVCDWVRQRFLRRTQKAQSITEKN